MGLRQFIFGSIFISLLVLLNYFTDRRDFIQLIACFAILFAIYLYWIKESNKQDFNYLLAIAIAARIALIFSTPNLSDDYFRFIWDGKLIANGINPFDYLPNELRESIFYQSNLLLINGMNSPEYYSIYPPALQFIFFISSYLSFGNISANLVLLKIFILVFESGTIFLLINLLKHFHLPKTRIFLYALNPLILTELSGNIHFEAGMIFFMLLTLYLILQNKLFLAAISFTIAVSIKLIPLLFLPAIFFYLKTKKGFIFSFSTLILIIISSLPFFYNWEQLFHFFTSFQLYFQKFEFNASLYYVFRYIGIKLTGYNQIAIIGKILPFIVMISALVFALKRNKNSIQLPIKLFWTLSIYLLFASIVHPWYLCPLIAFSVFTNYRFIILLSGLSVVSYFAYSSNLYTENYYLIAIEYSLAGIYFMYELMKNKKPNYLPVVR